MKRRTFLKSCIAVIAMPGLPAVKSMPELLFSAKNPITNLWAKTIFDYMLENVALTKILGNQPGCLAGLKDRNEAQDILEICDIY